MMEESEGEIGNEESALDLSSMSQHDLDALGRSLQADLVRLRDLRRAVVERSQLVASERARRRDRRLEETYAERRRKAVLSGEPLPEPPPSLDRAAAPTSAALRLAAAVIASPRADRKTPEPAVEEPVEPAVSRGTGVSDHAIVRYMERALGIDMDRIRAQIMSPMVESAMQAGVTRVRTSEGVFVLRDGTVISFLPSESRRPRKVSRGRPAVGWSDRDIETDEADD